MNQDESIIKTSSVTLGMSTGREPSPVTKTKPWNILVYGDFGFTSGQPEKVSSATIQDFIQTCGAVIRGNVENNLPSSVKPFFLEYPVSSLNDFGVDQVIQKVPELKALLEAKDIIEKMSSQKIPSKTGIEKLGALELPSSIKDPLMRLSPRDNITSSSPASTNVDSILSMIDLGDSKEQPSNSFIQAIANPTGETTLSAVSLNPILQQLNALISSTEKAILQSEAYSSAATTWYALRNLLKKVGRNRDISVSLYSRSADTALDALSDVLNACSESDSTPDLVLWNYEVLFTNASIDSLKDAASCADKYKTTIIASISSQEMLLKAFDTADTIRDQLQSPEFIAFKRFRKENCARGAVLCGPSFHLTGTGDNLIAGGAWLLLDQWLSSVISGNSPFDIASTSTAEIMDDRLMQYWIGESVAGEAASAGITLMRTRTGRVLSNPVVVMENENEGNYTSFGFNLLVNRTVRLTAELLSVSDRSTPIDEAAVMLHQYLYSQLGPYHILSSKDAVKIDVENSSTISIEIDSNVTLQGYPVRFQFSLGYR